MSVICPFLTKIKVTQINVAARTHTNNGTFVTGTNSATDTIDTEWLPIFCEDGVPSFTGNSDYCQIWDSVNSRCGLKTSDFLRNTNTRSKETTDSFKLGLSNTMWSFMDLFIDVFSSRADRDTDVAAISFVKSMQNVVGNSSERDIDDFGNQISLSKQLQNTLGKSDDRDIVDGTSVSLLVQLQNTLGKAADRDTDQGTPISLITQLSNIFGKSDERDLDGATAISLITWLKNIVGKCTERDLDNATPISLLLQLQNVLGKSSERDLDGVTAISLLTQLQNVIGKSADREGTYSLLTEFLNVLGKSSERETVGAITYSILKYYQEVIGTATDAVAQDSHMLGSIIKTMYHIHYLHLHREFPAEAITLIMEFLTNQDLDNGKVDPDWTVDSTGSIFGVDFFITEDDDCPTCILQIYDHPEWPETDPPNEVTWPKWLSLPDPGHDHNFP